MTLTELITEIRRTLSDVTGSANEVLWTDPEITKYLNDGVYTLCRKCRTLIPDSTTLNVGSNPAVPVCQIPILAGTQVYDKYPKIISIRRAKLATASTPLIQTSFSVVDNTYNWESITGTPTIICEDYHIGKLFLHPKPSANATLNLSVYRLPLTDLTIASPTTAPEIPAEYHLDLIPYVLYRCYSKQDTETMDKPKMIEWKTIYEERFEQIHREVLRKLPAEPINIPLGAL